MTEDIEYKLLRICESFDGCYVCEEYIEMDGVKRPLKDILKENIEQKRHITQLMIQNTLLKDKLGLVKTEVVRMGDDDG